MFKLRSTSRRLSQILELLDAAVLSAGFDNSIGGRQVDGCLGQSIRRIGCDARRVRNCPWNCPYQLPKRGVESQQQPSRSIDEVIETRGFARKNEDGREADRRLANLCRDLRLDDSRRPSTNQFTV